MDIVDIIVKWSQIIMLLLMGVGLIYAWVQIRLMQSNEADRKRLAVLSLIQELEYNKKLITEYVDHAEKGGNVTPNADGVITYELNKPSLIAYERNVVLACGNDEGLLKDIASLYEKIDACKVLVDEVLLIVANNRIDCMLGYKKNDFNAVVGKMNKRLSQEAVAVDELIDVVIKNLKFLHKSSKELKKIDMGKIKRIIAREGLIILGIAISGFIIAFVGDFIWQHSKAYIDWVTPSIYKYEPLSIKLFWNRALLLFSFYNFPQINGLKWGIGMWIEHLGEFVFLYSYLIYLPFRFIVWAARTLKEKK